MSTDSGTPNTLDVTPGERLTIATSSDVPELARLAHTIPKPRDWPLFQRQCVILFKAELNDPNVKEYGRNGQNQRGIDLLGCRDGILQKYVFVQCRLVEKPLTKSEISETCNRALSINAKLVEIIFATTAPDDTKADNAALEVESELAARGHSVRVVLYGWGNLQTLISHHPTAYNAFVPWSASSYAPLPPRFDEDRLVARVQTTIREEIRLHTVISLPAPADTATSSQEDPVLHARIDVCRDLLRDGESKIAAAKFLQILAESSLADRPWARYRLETNLGSALLHLGRTDDAADRLEAAYAVQPTNSDAIANYALALAIRGEFDAAMKMAIRARDAATPSKNAVAVLLQAASRSDWEGDPESLIPTAQKGTAIADAALSEFKRRRATQGWETECLALARRHPESKEFQKVRAVALLSLAQRAESLVVGAPLPFAESELQLAAQEMLTLASHYIDIQFADRTDLFAFVNNAALLLRLAGRERDCEELLTKAPSLLQEHAGLRRMLALSRALQHRNSEALAALDGDSDVDNRLVRAELLAITSPSLAFESLKDIDPATVQSSTRCMLQRIRAELAIAGKDPGSAKKAIAELQALDPSDLTADVLGCRLDGLHGEPLPVRQRRARTIYEKATDSTSLLVRYEIAKLLFDNDLPDEASRILEGHIGLHSPSPPGLLYLRSLGNSRRDAALSDALAQATNAVRETPEVLWVEAIFAWNIGDLPRARATLEKYLRSNPESGSAKLLQIELLLRQNAAAEACRILNEPMEDLRFDRKSEALRVATLLAHFGFSERAARLAYKLYLENRDWPRSWIGFSSILIDDGSSIDSSTWNASEANLDTAVDLKFDDGQDLFFIIEPDSELRKLDHYSWEPTHPLATEVLGLRIGERVLDAASGRQATVTNVRHKYIARLHSIMAEYERRFPTYRAFRSRDIDPEDENGLNALGSELRARASWIGEEQERYRKQFFPLAVLAHRLGLDTPTVAAGFEQQGLQLKVADGNEAERATAHAQLEANGGKGCALDLLTFWTAWRIGALQAVFSVAGPIHVARSLLDRLILKKELAENALRTHGGVVVYHEGEVQAYPTDRGEITRQIEELDAMLEWLGANASVCPVPMTDQTHETFRYYDKAGWGDVFDTLVLASGIGVLLVSDDLPTRRIGEGVGFTASTSLHYLLGLALHRRLVDLEAYVKFTASLIRMGQSYICVSCPVLLRALELDVVAGELPTGRFRTLASTIGGRTADPKSHLDVVIDCLVRIWRNPLTFSHRDKATSILLESLMRERRHDQTEFIRYLLPRVDSETRSYILEWMRGHFLPQRFFDALPVWYSALVPQSLR